MLLLQRWGIVRWIRRRRGTRLGVLRRLLVGLRGCQALSRGAPYRLLGRDTLRRGPPYRLLGRDALRSSGSNRLGLRGRLHKKNIYFIV